MKELKHIVEVEAKKHFGRWISLYEHFGGRVPGTDESYECVQIELWEEDFFRDIQNAKRKLWAGGVQFEDFCSDVEDNLSFVSNPICV